MKPKTFEEFLQEKHGELFPTLLDDDMPDHFDDWLGTLDGEDYIQYADEYGTSVRKEIWQLAFETLPADTETTARLLKALKAA